MIRSNFKYLLLIFVHLFISSCSINKVNSFEKILKNLNEEKNGMSKYIEFENFNLRVKILPFNYSYLIDSTMIYSNQECDKLIKDTTITILINLKIKNRNINQKNKTKFKKEIILENFYNSIKFNIKDLIYIKYKNISIYSKFQIVENYYDINQSYKLILFFKKKDLFEDIEKKYNYDLIIVDTITNDTLKTEFNNINYKNIIYP